MEQSVCKVCICYVFSFHERRSNFITVLPSACLSLSVCLLAVGHAARKSLVS